jgi:hypothetical protein
MANVALVEAEDWEEQKSPNSHEARRGTEFAYPLRPVMDVHLMFRGRDVPLLISAVARLSQTSRVVVWEDAKMKYAIVALLLAFSVTEAAAMVYCAAGAYHAGCVRRPAGGVVVAPVVGAAVVVAPRRVCPIGFRFYGGRCRPV